MAGISLARTPSSVPPLNPAMAGATTTIPVISPTPISTSARGAPVVTSASGVPVVSPGWLVLEFIRNLYMDDKHMHKNKSCTPGMGSCLELKNKLNMIFFLFHILQSLYWKTQFIPLALRPNSLIAFLGGSSIHKTA